MIAWCAVRSLKSFGVMCQAFTSKLNRYRAWPMEYYHFFVDAWRFFKRYKDIATNTQEFYDSVLESAGKIAKQYGERKLAMNIMIALVDELEAIAKGR